jgi:predicted O-linked N-acetylglucosamine transferase (SPINDLY family)
MAALLLLLRCHGGSVVHLGGTQLYPLPAAVKAWVAFAAIHHAVVSSQAPCGYSPRKRHTEPRKLRVGYLGSTFRNDPVGHLVFDLFAAHSDRVTVFCYAVTPDDGSVYRRRIQSSCANFRDVSGCSDSVIADVIRSDDVDVLVRRVLRSAAVARTWCV